MKINIKQLTVIVALTVSFVFSGCHNVQSGTEPDRQLNYTLRPVISDKGNNVLSIELVFKGDEDGETEIVLGEPWADEKTPEVRFRDILVSGNEAIIKPGKTSRTRIIQHAPSASLKVEYKLYEKDSRKDPLDSQFFYAPVITSEFIQIIGLTSLIIPHETRDDMGLIKVNARVNWSDLPPNWSEVKSPSARMDESQPITNLMSSAIIAGNFTPIQRSVGSKELTVVLLGQQAFRKDEFADQLAIILKALNKSWGDEPTDYLVSLLPLDLDPGSYSFTGTALDHAFVAAGTPNVELGFLSGFIAHEITHDWIPRRLGKFPQDAEGIYWFSEGFTDYFSLTLLRDYDLLTSEGFLEKTNEVLREYYKSPARNSTGAEIKQGFWTDLDIERQPYLRGFLIASLWDNEIFTKTNGKDTLISALQALKKKAELIEGELPTLSNAYVSAHFSEWVGRDVSSDVEDFYVKGKTIDPTVDWFGKCSEKKYITVYSYDVGFDPGQSIEAGMIKGLDPKSNAYKAGLRETFSFIEKVRGGGGDTTQLMVIKVSDGTKSYNISYFPRSGNPTNTPQFFRASDCN